MEESIETEQSDGARAGARDGIEFAPGLLEEKVVKSGAKAKVQKHPAK